MIQIHKNKVIDNDDAGRNTLAVLSAQFANAIDHSNLYFQFNDMNEYLTHTIQSANTINPISQQTKNSDYGNKS